MSNDLQTSATTAAPAQEPQSIIDPNKMKIAYFVGLNQNGDFVFDHFGTDKTIVQLLGLHSYATTRVEQLKSNSTMTGDRLIQEIGRLLLTTNQKLDQIMQVLAPKKASDIQE